MLPSLHPLRSLSALYRRIKKAIRLFIARSSSNKGQIPGGNNRSVATASINTRHHCDSFVEWEPVLLTRRSQRQKQFVNSFWLTLYWAMGRRINHPIIMPLEKPTARLLPVALRGHRRSWAVFWLRQSEATDGNCKTEGWGSRLPWGGGMPCVSPFGADIVLVQHKAHLLPLPPPWSQPPGSNLSRSCSFGALAYKLRYRPSKAIPLPADFFLV